MVDGFSCILDFPKFSGGGPPDPPYKGNTSIKPSNLSSTTTFKGKKKKKKKKKKERRALKLFPPLKQFTRNLSLGYTEIDIKFPF